MLLLIFVWTCGLVDAIQFFKINFCLSIFLFNCGLISKSNVLRPFFHKHTRYLAHSHRTLSLIAWHKLLVWFATKPTSNCFNAFSTTTCGGSCYNCNFSQLVVARFCSTVVKVEVCVLHTWLANSRAEPFCKDLLLPSFPVFVSWPEILFSQLQVVLNSVCRFALSFYLFFVC